MINKKELLKKVQSRGIVANLQLQQTAINEALNAGPFRLCLILSDTANIRIDPDLMEDLLRIQLGRNAHIIAKNTIK